MSAEGNARLKYSGTDEGFIHKNRTVSLVKPYQTALVSEAHSSKSNTGGNKINLKFIIGGNTDEFFRFVLSNFY